MSPVAGGPGDQATVDRIALDIADGTPDAIALAAPGRPPCTYAELTAEVGRIAAVVAGSGVGRPDRVAVMLPDGPAMAATFLGVAAAAACAPLNPRYREADLAFYLDDLQPRLVLVAAGLDSPIRQMAIGRGIPIAEVGEEPGAPAGRVTLHATWDPVVSPPAASEDVALILHTSGTTSRPKQVPLQHTNLCFSAANVARTLQLGPADRVLQVMPLFHIHGLVAGLLASLSVGASVACSPGFDASRFPGWLEELAPTWYTAVPTMHQAAVAAMASRAPVAHHLRFVRSSSSPLPLSVLRDLEEGLGVPVIEAYGMTEAAHQICSNPLPPGERKPGSVGLPAGPEVAIMEDHGRLLEAGGVGEIVIRGANVTAGYIAAPEVNAAAFTGGWFHTGDEGYIDADGYVTITGRQKELINRGGEKVAPREVEDVLLDHPDVAQAAVFALPHRRLGEEVAAAFVRRDGATVDEAELRRFVAGRVASFKVPRRLIALDEIPKGATGKLQRIGLAERLGLDAPPVVGHTVGTAIEAALAGLWAARLEVARVEPDDDFFALGGDSLLAVEVLADVEDMFGVAVPEERMVDDASTVRGMAQLVDELRAEGAPSHASRPNRALQGLVPIRTGGDQPVLLCVHLGAPMLRPFLPHLASDIPLYGIPARVAPGAAPAGAGIEEIAAHHLRNIFRSGIPGPYRVLGHSFGGLVAYELAQQLRHAGESVTQIVILDSIAPPALSLSPADPLRLHLRQATSLGGGRGVRSFARYTRDRTAEILRLRPARTARTAPDGDHLTHGVQRSRASRLYRVRPTEVAMLVFATERQRLRARARDLGWAHLAKGGLDLVETAGDHMSMLEPPHADAIAQRVAAALDAGRR